MKVKMILSSIFVLFFGAASFASDMDIFTIDTTRVQPNVLIVLDTSVNMNQVAGTGDQYDPVSNYPGAYLPGVVYYKKGSSYTVFRNSTPEILCAQARTSLETEGFYNGQINSGTTDCNGNKSYSLSTGNYLNYLSTAGSGPSQPRFGLAKGTLQSYINTTYGVRFGLMVFNQDQGGSILAEISDMIPQNRSGLHSTIGGLKADDTWSPLAEALYEAGLYFEGGPSYFNRGVTYASPIQYPCQKNYVIYVSAGQSTKDRDPILQTLGNNGDTNGDGADPGTFADDGSHYVDDVARYLYDTDLRSDLDGKQDLITYTIGFTPTCSLLELTAENGRGKYFYVHNAQSFAIAMQSIIEEILAQTVTYAAPVIPISQMEKTTSGSKIYLALFKPSEDAFWKGNIKKFSIATKDNQAPGISVGDVLDANGNRATDSMGRILDTAVSFWGTEADGGDAEAGGVGQVLHNRSTPRNIYTYLGSKTALTDSSNAFQLGNAAITPAKLGLASGDTAGRDKIINFVYGLDAYDENGNYDTTEKRSWVLGAFIHSRPAVVSYDPSTTVIFAGANDGMLHAFQDSDGSELWAFIPPDLLANLKLLNGTSLTYFVDGAPKAYVIDNNGDGIIKPPDGDRVILVFGERRGGSHYYALDVTNPNAPVFLWDINPGETDFSEMGQSWCTPVFGTVAYGTKSVVFLSGGYDPNQDNDPVSAKDTMGRGVYLADLLTGSLVWKYTNHEDANVYWSIPSDITALDSNDSGLTDRLYVGDMGGRLWRFDIKDTDPSKWTGKILFNANSTPSDGRKIFYPADVTQEEGFEFLFFGTGDREHPKNETVVDRIYAVKDTNPSSALNEASLVDVTADLLQDPNTSDDAKTNIRNSLGSGNGWYIRLDGNPGEKVLAPALTLSGTTYLTTFTPSSSGDPCLVGEGTARLYALSYKTGESAFNYDTSNDTNGSMVVAKTDRSQIIGAAIPSGMVVAMIDLQPLGFIGVSGGIVREELNDVRRVIKTYWRQVF